MIRQHSNVMQTVYVLTFLLQFIVEHWLRSRSCHGVIAVVRQVDGWCSVTAAATGSTAHAFCQAIVFVLNGDGGAVTAVDD